MCAKPESVGRAVHKVSLVDSSEAETPGVPRRIWGLANGVQRSPLSRTAYHHYAANPVNLRSSLKLLGPVSCNALKCLL